jgi:hypothetical protein
MNPPILLVTIQFDPARPPGRRLSKVFLAG